MDHLDKISVQELQQALDEVAGKKPTQRLIAAIAYKNGVSQTELAEVRSSATDDLQLAQTARTRAA